MIVVFLAQFKPEVTNRVHYHISIYDAFHLLWKITKFQEIENQMDRKCLENGYLIIRKWTLKKYVFELKDSMHVQIRSFFQSSQLAMQIFVC